MGSVNFLNSAIKEALSHEMVSSKVTHSSIHMQALVIKNSCMGK